MVAAGAAQMAEPCFAQGSRKIFVAFGAEESDGICAKMSVPFGRALVDSRSETKFIESGVSECLDLPGRPQATRIMSPLLELTHLVNSILRAPYDNWL